jgi:hypothetical protein
MDESEAVEEEAGAATPIFGVYRRGYDPEQVDRYVADHQRRLDEALHRASESERKLAAAVGQLRELHRRVAVYESEARNAQPPQLDTLGERVQRILQEAWEGAYNLRQEAEREVNELRDHTQQEVETLRVQARVEVEELREVASREAAEVVDEATRRALHIRDETERRRQAYLERVERDREQAIAQITYLYDQRQGAIAELARLQATVQATIEEMVRSPLGRPTGGVAEAASDGTRARRAAAGRAHPASPPSGTIPGVGPGSAATTPPEHADVEHLSIEDPEAVESSEAQASQLPEVLGAPEGVPEGAATSGADLPTGPMERFVRPSDRDAARAAKRHAGAEANAMERTMRDAPSTPSDGRTQGAGPSSGGAGSASLGLDSSGPTDVVGRGGARGAHAGSGRAATVFGGLIRPRRQPTQQGVYDAEQDDWT